MVFPSDKDYRQLSQKLDYEFKDRNLLELALTHKSVLDPKGSYIESNERLASKWNFAWVLLFEEITDIKIQGVGSFLSGH